MPARAGSAQRAIKLHFHDLRREAGSRFLEGGMPANVVQQFLDHAKLFTTSRYLKITRDRLHAAMNRFEKAREEGRKNEERPKDSAPDPNPADSLSHEPGLWFRHRHASGSWRSIVRRLAEPVVATARKPNGRAIDRAWRGQNFDSDKDQGHRDHDKTGEIPREGYADQSCRPTPVG